MGVSVFILEERADVSDFSVGLIDALVAERPIVYPALYRLLSFIISCE